MERTLKTGRRMTRTDGSIVTRQASGRTVQVLGGGREKILPSAVLELSQEEVDANPNSFHSTPDEIAMGKKDRLRKEEEFWGRQGKEVPEVVRASLTGYENKMATPDVVKEEAPIETPTEKPSTCPECNGAKAGVGYRHAESCPKRSSRARS